MARSTKISESPAPIFHDDLYEASPAPRQSQRSDASHASLSPSPVASVSSDKENTSSRRAVDKGKGRAPMESTRRPTPNEYGKRKRGTELDNSGERSRRLPTVEADEDTLELDYDPDQDIHVRRKLRKGLRDLSKNLLDNRAEYLNPASTGLRDTILKANELAGQVKQTADATIDSRLLVTAADYSYKKTLALTTGDTAQGVDIDEFVSKCISFMRQGDGLGQDRDHAPSSTQRRRGQGHDEDEDDEENNGEAMDWQYLGRHACLKHNSRPSVPGFLLGPLSLEKRVRKMVVRKAPLRPKNLQETRPEVLQAGDIERSENANLTGLCHQILGRLQKVRRDAMAAAEAEFRDDITEKEGEQLMDRYGLSTDGGIALFKFVINPYSFGQTIENMFYTSFLIRDGKLGISMDDRGLPYLDIPNHGGEGTGKKDQSKHQAVLALDMATWKQLIDVFDIKEPMIQHREEEEHSNVGVKGWYA